MIGGSNLPGKDNHTGRPTGPEGECPGWKFETTA